MDNIEIKIEDNNFCSVIQYDDSNYTINLQEFNQSFCVEVEQGIGSHKHPISDIIGLQDKLDEIDDTLDVKADLVDGKVPASQLPSYVDDVLEFPTLGDFPTTGESGIIYLALDTNLTYRWAGTTYAEISPSLALGETSSTAYRGDRGKIAYDHSQTIGNPHNTTLQQVTNSGNTTTNTIQVASVFAGYYDINTSAIASNVVGRIKWNSTDGTFDFGLLNGVTGQNFQEQHIYGKAVGTIADGSPVQFAGVQGNHILIKTAVVSEINANPEYFIGIATQSFTNNQFGYVTTFGKVNDVNTSGYTEGSVLYFDSVNGGLTSTIPSYPNARIIACAVIRSHATQGILMVRPHMIYYADWNEINNKPSTFPPSAHTHSISDVIGLQTALDSKEPTITAGTTSQYWRGDKTWQTLDKNAVGLSNVDNTSDLNKPISQATSNALSGKEPTINFGTTAQYFRGDKTWQTLNSSAVGLGNVPNVDATNPANISQNASYRFVTDTEKATWNAKQNALTNPITGTGVSGRVAFFNGTTTQTSDADLFWDNTNKRLGLGTTSPSERLQVNGNIRVDNGAADGGQLVLASSGFTDWNIDNFSGAFRFYNGATERMRITSSGDLFLGSSTQINVEKFGVTYNSQDRLGFVLNDTFTGGATAQIAIQFRRNGSAVGSITNSTTTTSYNTMSDYRLKKDFKDFNGIELVNQMKVYDFAFNSDDSRMYGVKAHELQEVIPYAVTGEKDGEQMQSVDYSKLVPMLIKAVQEQQRQIDELKEIIKNGSSLN